MNGKIENVVDITVWKDGGERYAERMIVGKAIFPPLSLTRMVRIDFEGGENMKNMKKTNITLLLKNRVCSSISKVLQTKSG